MNRITPLLPLLTLVILVIVILVFVDGQCNGRRIDELTHRQFQANNITEQWRRQDSAQVTVASANYVTKQDLKHGDAAMLDTLRKEVVGKLKTLERTTKVIATRLESITVPVRDTVRVLPSGVNQPGYVFDYSRPPFLKRMHGVLFAGDSLRLDYEIMSQYLLEYHWKKVGLFKPKELELIITNPDPAVTVDRVQQFQVVAPAPFWERPGIAIPVGFAAGLGVGLAISK